MVSGRGIGGKFFYCFNELLLKEKKILKKECFEYIANLAEDVYKKIAF
jgi:hypothetical protein